MRTLLPILTGLALLAGCSHRDRLNPLDPLNPVTGGAPAGFAALAEDGLVRLVWQRPTNTTTLGVRILRKVPPATTFTPLADLPAGDDSYVDAGLANGLDHAYQAQFLLVDGGVGPTVEDIATPGPAVPWISDYTARALLRSTPDARHVAERVSGPFESAGDLDVDHVTGRVWMCDPYAGKLWAMPRGGSPVSMGALVEPVATAVDPTTGRGWVCDDGRGGALSFDPSNPATPVAEHYGLATPISVAVDPVDGSAWVCERTGDAVRHLSSTGSPVGSANVVEPSRVAVDSLTRRIWVTSLNQRRVVVASAAGALVDTIAGLSGPIGIAVDPRAGRVWVADTGGDRLVVLDRNGAQLFVVTGLPQPREVSIDRATGEAWVTLPAIGQVARVGPTGIVIRRLTGLVQPLDVALQ